MVFGRLSTAEMFSLLLTYFCRHCGDQFLSISSMALMAWQAAWIIVNCCIRIYFLNVNANMLPYAVVAFSLAGSLLASYLHFQPAKILWATLALY